MLPVRSEVPARLVKRCARWVWLTAGLGLRGSLVDGLRRVVGVLEVCGSHLGLLPTDPTPTGSARGVLRVFTPLPLLSAPVFSAGWGLVAVNRLGSAREGGPGKEVSWDGFPLRAHRGTPAAPLPSLAERGETKGNLRKEGNLPSLVHCGCRVELLSPTGSAP